MRASSLSDKDVKRLLSNYFIPVMLGTSQPLPKAERETVKEEASRAGVTNWSVGVYIIEPGGRILKSMGVVEAIDPKKLRSWLQSYVKEGDIKPRDPKRIPVARMQPPAPPAPKASDGLLLHVMTGYVTGATDLGLSHNWIELKHDEWSGLLPPKDAPVGTVHEIPVSGWDRLFRCFFPPISDWSVTTSKVKKVAWKSTVSATSAREVRLSLEVSLDMLHHEDLDRLPPSGVRAILVGTAVYDREKDAVTSFELVSTKALFTMRWGDKAKPKEDVQKFAIGVENQP